MPSLQFHAYGATVRLSVDAAAALLGVAPSTARKWCYQVRPVPAWAHRLAVLASGAALVPPFHEFSIHGHELRGRVLSVPLTVGALADLGIAHDLAREAMRELRAVRDELDQVRARRGPLAVSGRAPESQGARSAPAHPLPDAG